MTPLAHLFALPIRAYRLTFSPWVGFNCRYQPTCSAYALEALQKHGAIKVGGSPQNGLAAVIRGGADGFDPVPGCEHDHDCDDPQDVANR